MTNSSKTLLSVTLATSLLGLAGCGGNAASDSRSLLSNTTPRAYLTGNQRAPVQRIPFNQVIEQAMAVLLQPPLPATPLYAPAQVPIFAGAARQFVTAYAHKTGPANYPTGYDVRLYLVPRPLPVNAPNLQNDYPTAWFAGFSGVAYASAGTAAAHVNATAGIKPIRGTGTRVNLGYGITGQEFRVVGRKDTSYLENTAVIWREGKWQIGVYHLGSRIPDVTLARQMVAYLNQHTLPVPDTNGAITVSDDGPKYTYAHIAWSKGKNLYYEYNYLHPMDALTMAVSTQLFTK